MPSRYIDGVYNYCDRWCERCPLAGRCRLFTMERRLNGSGGVTDPVAFWAALELRVPPEVELEDDTENGPDLSGSLSADPEAPDAPPLAREKHPLAEAAMQLSLDVHRWLRQHGRELGRLPASGPDGVSPADAVEVLNWYCLQIGVKLSRALTARPLDDGSEPWEAEPDWRGDADESDRALEEARRSDRAGSAKVAILGIERSLGAWTVLRDALPEHDAEIVAFQRRLARLRRKIDEAVPDARTFIRPGFDDGTLPDRP